MEIKTSKIFGLRAVIEAINSESPIEIPMRITVLANAGNKTSNTGFANSLEYPKSPKMAALTQFP